MSRLADLQRLYRLLGRQEIKCGGPQPLSSLVRRVVPPRGVYFFFEAGESRSESGEGSRVVRVGTHGLGLGSRSTLAQRLSQHRGRRSGGGNHRGSIFRLLVGQALMASGAVSQCASWGTKSDAGKAAAALGSSLDEIKAGEAPVESAVSGHIGAMRVVWVELGDEPGPSSLRGFVERHAIGLLSNRDRTPLDAASPSWLGHHSDRPLVRSSGLWNQNHVEQAYDASFLDCLERLLVEGTDAEVR